MQNYNSEVFLVVISQNKKIEVSKFCIQSTFLPYILYKKEIKPSAKEIIFVKSKKMQVRTGKIQFSDIYCSVLHTRPPMTFS